jgi:hypothetical protein
MPCAADLSSFDHLINMGIWWCANYEAPHYAIYLTCYFFAPMIKCSAQHPVFKHPQSTVHKLIISLHYKRNLQPERLNSLWEAP